MSDEQVENQKNQTAENKVENSQKTTSQVSQIWHEYEAKNFVDVEYGAGSLLKAARSIEDIMKINDRTWSSLKKGQTVLPLWHFINTVTKEHVLILFHENSKHMYMTKEFEQDFEVLIQGTYIHKDTEKTTEK